MANRLEYNAIAAKNQTKVDEDILAIVFPNMSNSHFTTIDFVACNTRFRRTFRTIQYSVTSALNFAICACYTRNSEPLKTYITSLHTVVTTNGTTKAASSLTITASKLATNRTLPLCLFISTICTTRHEFVWNEYLFSRFHRMANCLEDKSIAAKAQYHVDENKLAMMFSEVFRIIVQTKQFLALFAYFWGTIGTIGYSMTNASNLTIQANGGGNPLLLCTNRAQRYTFFTTNGIAETALESTVFTIGSIAFRAQL